MYAVIGGQTVTIDHGSVSGQAQVGQRATAMFNVIDPTAAYAFAEGSQALIYDAGGNLLLSRWVAKSQRRRMSQAGLLYHQLTCTDNAYLADKRLAATTYTSQTAQFIVNDLVAQYLAAEGVYGVRNSLSANQSSVETNTTGFTVFGTGAAISRDTAQHWGGLASLKYALAAGSGDQYVEITGATTLGATTGLWSVTQGHYYALSAYVLSDGTATPRLRIAEYNSAGTYLRDATQPASAGPSSATTWTRLTWTYTPSVDAAAIKLRVFNNGARPGVAVAFWVDGLQWEPAFTATQPASAFELGGTTTIQGAAVTIGSFTANYAPVSACLDAIAQKAQGYSWWIDENRRLYFTTSSPNTPPVSTIDDTIIERDTEQASHGNTQYRNTQYILGGMAQTSSQTETRQGDGKTVAFTMGYPLAKVPTITLNTVAQTVGIKGVDTGKQWYWSAGDPVITQDSGGTKLISTDTLSVTYVGQYPIVTISSDSAGITARQMREGGMSSGIVESVATDTTLATVTDAFQVAAGYLARYNQDTQELTFMTTTAGFQPGQSVTVNIPGMNLTSVPMQIESVTMADSGPLGGEVAQLYYTVKAVQGPLAAGGARFWRALALQAQQIQIDAINVGSSGLVAIAQTGTVGWTWTLTGSATVFTVQFPSATLYPATNLYPGGTAGTPTAITWTKTNAALNALRDVLSGNGTTLKAGYLAWGTGTQGTPATATQLAAESGRKALASITNGASIGEEIITGIIGPSDGVGVAITEVAIFGGPAASGAANSGVMLLYGLYSHTHTNQENIEIQADGTFA